MPRNNETGWVFDVREGREGKRNRRLKPCCSLPSQPEKCTVHTRGFHFVISLHQHPSVTVSVSQSSLSPRFHDGEVIPALRRYESTDEELGEREGGKQWNMLRVFLCADIEPHTSVPFLCVPSYDCVCGKKWDAVQLPLSPSLNGLLIESNEGVLSEQMCAPRNSVLPRDHKADPSETSAGTPPLPGSG